MIVTDLPNNKQVTTVLHNHCYYLIYGKLNLSIWRLLKLIVAKNSK
jgi:hypothetical protein